MHTFSPLKKNSKNDRVKHWSGFTQHSPIDPTVFQTPRDHEKADHTDAEMEAWQVTYLMANHRARAQLSWPHSSVGPMETPDS